MEAEIKLDDLRIAVEEHLVHQVDCCIPPEYSAMKAQLAYHLGWEGEGAGVEAQGKRIRPVLLLLACAAAGGDWRAALPAACAVELIHNFSLIHDDIQDQSPLRRGRPTVWVKWGTAQAINAGDLMFTLAFTAVQELKDSLSPEAALAAHGLLQATCVRLTGGQYLDLFNEKTRELSLEDYWRMIAGKTAALLGCSAELGALCAGAAAEQRQTFREFGEKLGLAFQVQDDWLGIWGDAALTGKSTESDLVSGKKSFPVVVGLSLRKEFARRWLAGAVQPSEVGAVAALLQAEGAKEACEAAASRLTQEARAALNKAGKDTPGKAELLKLAESLLRRNY